MKPTLGEELRIFVFDGDFCTIKAEVDGWMEGPGKVFEVVDIQYNFQVPAFVGSAQVTDTGMHGVLIVARQLTANDVRTRRGLTANDVRTRRGLTANDVRTRRGLPPITKGTVDGTEDPHHDNDSPAQAVDAVFGV